jgi:hypothetical protein
MLNLGRWGYVDVKVGDKVEVRCEDRSSHFPDVEKKFVGVVTEVFDALTKDLKEGINLEIDIHGPQGQWFRYKPLIDGGTIKVLNKEKK